MHHSQDSAIKTIVGLVNNDHQSSKELRLHNRYDEQLWLIINEGMGTTISSAEKVMEVVKTSYIVTGYYYNSQKKFRTEVSSKAHAMGINLWDGRVWEEKTYEDGSKKRRLIKRVVN